MEWTRHVLENMEPKASVKPAIRVHIRAVQMEGNAVALVKCESSPSRMTLV